MEGLDLDGRRGPVRRGAQEELERCDLDGFGGEQLAGYAHGRYRRREKRYVLPSDFFHFVRCPMCEVSLQ